MLEIMYLNVYTFSFVNYVTTFAICLPTNFHFLLYFTKVGQTVFCNGWPDTPRVPCTECSMRVLFCPLMLWCQHSLIPLSSGTGFQGRLLCICAVWPCRSPGQGQWHGLTGKDTRHQAYWPEFDPKDPPGGRSELYFQIILWILNMCSDGIHIHAITLYVHIHTYLYIHSTFIHM